MLRAQEFKLFDHEVQAHGWISEGIVHTNDNNWLTMNTSSGSGVGSMTDMGFNLSSQLSDKLYVGAQVYDRNVGKLGQWHPSLDWAVMRYRIRPWLGVRGGKVKTTIGLMNDTQDQDFLYPFALLPQSVYPLDLRDATIAHLGGDLYGDITLGKRLGTLSYTLYAGQRSDSRYSGYPYLLSSLGINVNSFGGLQHGEDLRWNTPLKGLLVGASRLDEDITGRGQVSIPPAPSVPYVEHSKSDWVNQFYGQYSHKNLQIDAEYRRYWRDQIVQGGLVNIALDARGWYVAGAYRVSKHLQLGSYYSRYTQTSVFSGALNIVQLDTSLPTNHVYDKVVSARFDINRHWIAKLEGHFMDGYGFGSAVYPLGFYPQVNPGGFSQKTNGLVAKTSFVF
jgi:hypothetical protein